MSKEHIVVLAGGVGGAKLADGLAQILPPEQLTIIVNTGDDFNHLGLTICPDLDTVMYNLAGTHNIKQGWGREGESWTVMNELKRLGGPDWFNLGDLDLATHLLRATQLQNGTDLTTITKALCEKFNIDTSILPMSDQSLPTLIETETMGTLSFQDWFVRERWQPVVQEVKLPAEAKATTAVYRALDKATTVIFAPSNPFVSIDPILNCYPIREMIEDLPKNVIAVSPIIGHEAVKGPAAKLMNEFGLPVTAKAVANYYEGLLTGFVFDKEDEGQLDDMIIPQLCTNSIMTNREERRQLATEILAFARSLK